MMLVVYIQLFFMPILFVFGKNNSKCISQGTCRECIQEIHCVWCVTPPDNQPHCVDENYLQSINNSCPDPISPKSKWFIVQNDEFSSNITNPVQIKPQRIKVSLRKGESVDLHFQYKQAENYPVDLYYLMDLSSSMENYRKTLGLLGVQLAEALKNITSNVRLGFGSFIDKVELPFTSTAPNKLKSPCKKNESCAPPYSFKNHLSLTQNYNEFRMQVTNAIISGNLDTPEGGLDAIMQAIVCKEQIYWRPQARHLLIYSTDAEFHIAGDGKLAGVIKPNDAKCHMENNYYNGYLIYDYPSISQTNYVAIENNINIIFAIVNKNPWITTSYQQLSESIQNSNFGVLHNNENNNIINLVLENYKKIIQSVRLTPDTIDDIDVKLSSTCNNFKDNECSGIHVGETVSYTATIELRNCPINGSTTKIISIKTDALNESLIIEVDVICDCSCSSATDSTYQKKSVECTGHGDLECGICKCDSDRFGINCECDSFDNLSNNTSTCKMDNQSEVCSGLGECKCGKCECNNKPTIYGPFCECNDYSCKREGGDLCSGNGICKCKVCSCHAGYKGDACECLESTTPCIAPGSDLVCSGFGICKCGQCECNISEGHSGKYCEECTTCPAQRCEELRHCVECRAYHTGIYSKSECDMNCTDLTIIIDEKSSDENDDEIKKCRVQDKMGCRIIFEYTYNDDKALKVTVQKEKVCVDPPNILAWILGVIGTILLAGLVILIVWKVCTTVHDMREYAKFEDERKALQWHRNDNPLYRQATSTFANPVYNRSSRLSSQ